METLKAAGDILKQCEEANQASRRLIVEGKKLKISMAQQAIATSEYLKSTGFTALKLSNLAKAIQEIEDGEDVEIVIEQRLNPFTGEPRDSVRAVHILRKDKEGKEKNGAPKEEQDGENKSEDRGEED
jgi:hypothetical protein